MYVASTYPTIAGTAAWGLVLDYDAAGNLVGIDIDNAGVKVQLDRLVPSKLPARIETVAG
jgi:hypothetical protein